jgi:sterol desaturase/sphingolipid hydroxylase (fatty acid hydroxylase superfamily)
MIAAYLVPALLLCSTFLLGALVTRGGKPWSHQFPLSSLLHTSARADVFIWVTKRLLKLLWAFPFALSAAGIGGLVHSALLRGFTVPPTLHHGAWYIAGFVASLTVSRDWSFYWYHRALHSNKYLWELHKVHHSAERMVGFTDQRVHPVDDLLYYIWDGLLTGVVYGIWLLVIAPPVSVTVFGVSVILLINILSFGYLHHMPYKLSLGWLNYLLVAPHYHQLHHSVHPKHYNSNFGSTLIVWDLLFGTVCVPGPGEDFTYGLQGDEAKDYHSAFGLFVVPLIKIASLLLAQMRKSNAAVHVGLIPGRSEPQ